LARNAAVAQDDALFEADDDSQGGDDYDARADVSGNGGVYHGNGASLEQQPRAAAASAARHDGSGRGDSAAASSLFFAADAAPSTWALSRRGERVESRTSELARRRLTLFSLNASIILLVLTLLLASMQLYVLYEFSLLRTPENGVHGLVYAATFAMSPVGDDDSEAQPSTAAAPSSLPRLQQHDNESATQSEDVQHCTRFREMRLVSEPALHMRLQQQQGQRRGRGRDDTDADDDVGVGAFESALASAAASVHIDTYLGVVATHPWNVLTARCICCHDSGSGGIKSSVSTCSVAPCTVHEEAVCTDRARESDNGSGGGAPSKHHRRRCISTLLLARTPDTQLFQQTAAAASSSLRWR
jgi:hypothetical protein